MKNFANMMKQAREMQKNMQAMQEKMADMEIEGSAANGAVKVVLNGKNEAKKITIDPAIVDADDVETLEDVLLAAFNDAAANVAKTVETEVNQITGGMNIPGLG